MEEGGRGEKICDLNAGRRKSNGAWMGEIGMRREIKKTEQMYEHVKLDRPRAR